MAGKIALASDRISKSGIPSVMSFFGFLGTYPIKSLLPCGTAGSSVFYPFPQGIAIALFLIFLLAFLECFQLVIEEIIIFVDDLCQRHILLGGFFQ